MSDTPILITLVRHGETAFNKERRVQGSMDTPLADSGLAQAQRLVGALQPLQFDGVYCSDLTRTRQTLAPYAQVTDRHVNYLESLRERRFGWFEGRTLDEACNSHPERLARLEARDPSYDLHGGESLVNFYQRSVGALREIARRHRPGQHLLVVTHGGVLDCVQRWARDLALNARRDFEILNTSINCVAVAGDECEIKTWAQVSHL